MNSKTYSALTAFRSFCPIMVICSTLSAAFAAVTYMGLLWPCHIRTFASTKITCTIAITAGLLGLAAALLGRSAAKGRIISRMWMCGWLSAAAAVLYWTFLFLSGGAAGLHVWLVTGVTSIFPGVFAGYAFRLAARGLDDVCGG